MSDISLQVPHYPLVAFMLRHGQWFIVVLASIPVWVALLSAAAGAPVWWLALALVMSAVAWMLLRLLLELLQILSDFILPR